MKPENELLHIRKKINSLHYRDTRERLLLDALTEVLNYVGVLEEKLKRVEAEQTGIANDLGDHLLTHEKSMEALEVTTKGVKIHTIKDPVELLRLFPPPKPREGGGR